MVQTPGSGWEEADGTTSWTFNWDSTTVEDGEHTISAMAMDKQYSQSPAVYVTVNVNSPNQPPNIPSTPTGPTLLIEGEIGQYNTSTTDPEGDQISYLFSWGDGNLSSWTTPIVSGATVSESYNWSDGSYDIKVKAKDIYGANSDWSPVLHVVVTDDPEPPIKYPDLECKGLLQWSEIKPNLVVSGEFTIENVGDSYSLLNWEIADAPEWGNWTFTPSEGHNLTPEGGLRTVNVLVVAPEEKNQNFTGEIKIVNMENESDFETIVVSLSTTKTKVAITPFIQFLENHPHLFPLLRQILGL